MATFTKQLEELDEQAMMSKSNVASISSSSNVISNSINRNDTEQTLRELLDLFKKADQTPLTVIDPQILKRLDALETKVDSIQSTLTSMNQLLRTWQTLVDSSNTDALSEPMPPSAASSPMTLNALNSTGDASHKNFGSYFDKNAR